MATAGSHSYVRILVACLAAVMAAALIPVTASAAPAAQDRVERAIIAKVNALRAGAGKAPLRPSRALARAADWHSADMVSQDYFGHGSSDGQGVQERVQAFRRSDWVGETLAYMPPASGAVQAESIVGMWMNSQAHRESLMDGRFRRIGVARRSGMLGGRPAIVFTADLASRR